MRRPPPPRADEPAPASVYLTAEQVGELLQLSTKTIYRLAKDDPTIPALKLGGTVRFPRERLERWLRDREQGRGRPRLALTVPEQQAGAAQARLKAEVR